MGINNNAKLFLPGTILNQNLFGTFISLQTAFNFSIQIFFSGTPNGLFFLQGSDDPFLIPTSSATTVPIHWSNVANSVLSVAAPGDVLWNYRMAGFDFVRPVFTDLSGGTSTAQITFSSFNGK